MASNVDGRVKVKDWDLAFDQFMMVAKPSGKNQEDFAAELGVDHTYLSLKFSEIRRQRTLHDVKLKMPQVLKKALDNVEEALALEADERSFKTRTGMSVTDKAHFALDTYKAVADREGMSPQAVTINMQQNNSNSFIIPPIFSSNENEPELQNLLKGNDAPD